MRKVKKSELLIILILVVVFIGIIIANSRLIIRSMVNQTQQTGQTQIDSIKTDFENHIASAENSLIRVASGAEQLLKQDAGMSALESYIKEQKKAQLNSSDGVNFNVYIAGLGWEIIPDFDAPADYHATERNWYVGAADNAGDIYITSPYIDSMTGEMCYTLSVMLKDKETVVAMDFTLSEIQDSVQKMSLSEGSSAMIVAKDGLIVGYTDMSYVGKELKKSLPEYDSVLQKIQDSRSEESFRTTVNGNSSTIFYSITKNNWYMILSVNDSELYSTTTRQVLINAMINLMMLIVIVILFILIIKNRIRTEKAQTDRERFVNNLLDKMKEPIRNVIAVGDKGSDLDFASTDDYADIKASGLRMNEIMNDLASYSSIALRRNENEEKKGLRLQSGHIRLFRNIIVFLLLTVMLISSFLYFRAGQSMIDYLMSMGRNYYAYQLEEWEQVQMNTLNMFTDVISARPDLVEDYDSAVKWMDSVAKKYPSISVCYLANPYSEHTVIMNNGWQPDSDWKVEERDWYKKTEKSDVGYSISDPYYDEQTGNYCITISKMVYGESGEFIGIFGIDLYMDKIIDIFGADYTEDEYVFLVDSNGDIINHPNPDYQMSQHKKVNVKDTPYLEVYNNTEDEIISYTDYYGTRRSSKITTNKTTGFSVILVWKWTNVFLYQILYAAIYSVVILAIVIAIIILINKVIHSQNVMNHKLENAVNDATAAGKAKSDFLAQMSHEIRTPINAVIGMDEMILRESDDPGIREYAMDIKNAGNTLLTLINGILDFSKIESGKMEIVPVKYETAGMIDNLVNLINDRAEKKKLSFQLSIDEHLPRTLYGDDVRIRQVITNLLTNAVKYTEKGGVILTVRGENISPEECTLFVEVRDTGIGIKDEDREKLFQSFQRLEERRNRAIEGTGLGMSIVVGILQLMDSSLNVESIYGEGSAFSFRIRQNVIDVTPLGKYERRREKLPEHIQEKELRIKKADILVVDDNEMNLKVARSLMKKLHVVPDLSSSGASCIEMIKKKHYDIILMDHMMPDMDGIETLKKLQEEALVDDSTAVIALTANAIAGSRERYLALGFRDYLSKPIEPDELERILAEWLPPESYTYVKPGEEESIKEAAAVNDEKKAANPVKHSEWVERLKERGINVDTALGYMMQDEQLYREMLETFIGDTGSRKEEISRFYAEKNLKDYQIRVHALKSASRNVGADVLAELAFEQEMAAEKMEVSVVEEGFSPMMAEYDRIITLLTEIIGTPAGEKDSTEESPDEIMEFYPD